MLAFQKLRERDRLLDAFRLRPRVGFWLRARSVESRALQLEILALRRGLTFPAIRQTTEVDAADRLWLATLCEVRTIRRSAVTVVPPDFFRTRRDSAVEILELRQQVAVLKRERPRPDFELLGPALLDSVTRLLAALARCPCDRQA